MNFLARGTRLVPFFTFLFWAFSISAGAQTAGALDPTFDARLASDGGIVYGSAITNEGKSLIVGNFHFVNDTYQYGIARLLADGNPDPAFNAGAGANGTIYGLAIDAQNRILVVGDFTTFANAPRSRIARLNPDGTLDGTFNPGTGADDTVLTVATDTQGRTVIGGFFTSFNGTPRSRLARLNPDGSLDSAFNPSAANTVNRLRIDSQGRIVIAGLFYVVNGTSRPGIARLNDNGSLDATFAPSGGADYQIFDFAIDAQGRYVIGGEFGLFNGTVRSRVARVNPDGSLDTTFSPLAGADGFVFSVSIDNQGRIYFGGRFFIYGNTSRRCLVRTMADGTVDPDFLPATASSTDTFIEVRSTLPLPNQGGVFVGGVFRIRQGQFVSRFGRFQENGTLDQSFLSRIDGNSTVNALAQSANGDLIAGGRFNFSRGIRRNHLARFTPNGNLDQSFNTGDGAFQEVKTVATAANRKVVAGGLFQSFNNLQRPSLARVTASGALDGSFQPIVTGGGVDQAVIDSANRVVIGGVFFQINLVSINNLARLNNDATLDTTFNAGTGPNGYIYAMAQDTQGRILIGGTFNQYNGVTQNFLSRLNSNGTIDQTFNMGFGPSVNVWAIALDNLGRIVIAGQFVEFNRTTRIRVARLNPDGSLDTTFNPGLGPDATVRCVAIDSQNRVIIGGEFTTVAGVSRNRIARLNATGGLDTTFDPGSGCNGIVRSVLVDPFDRVVAGGDFTTFNGQPRCGLVRLNGDQTCTFGISPNTGNFPVEGGGGSATVTSGPCQWTASGIPDWIAGFPASGSGTNTVSFTVSPNSGPARSANIRVGDATLTISQTSACSFALDKTSLRLDPPGGTRKVFVSTGTSCTWNAISNDDWISVTSGASGTGNGTVQLQIQPIPPVFGLPRTGTVTIAGMTFTVTQSTRQQVTVGAFRPSNGFVYLKNTNATGFADSEFFYGQANDIPVAGDWDGNGTDTIGIYRNGTFYLRNSNTAGFADIQFPFGSPGDLPIVGDWDGDGIDTVGIVRGNQVLLRNSNTPGFADIEFFYGTAGDIFLAGDWNGDGIDTVGCFRPSNGFVYIRNTNTTGFADLQFFYGQAGDKPVVGDWNADGVDTIGIVRGNQWFLRDSNSSGFADLQFFYGASTDIPITGDWNDQPY